MLAQDDDDGIFRQQQPCQTADAVKRWGPSPQTMRNWKPITLSLTVSGIGIGILSLLQSTVYFAEFNVTAADLVGVLDGQRVERHF